MALSKEEKERRKEQRRRDKWEQEHKVINGVLYKKCNKHDNYFPEEDNWLPCTEEYFYKNKTNSIDGLSSRCKECEKQESYEWRKPNRDKYLEGLKRYNQKEEHKKDILERRRIYREDGKALIWQRNNPNRLKEYAEKRKNKNHKISKTEWNNCLKYFNYECAYCGLPIEKHKQLFNQQLHKEHVDDNGANDLSNCIPSCKTCNSSKHDNLFEIWYNQNNPKFDLDRYNKIIKWLEYDHKQYIEENKPKRK